ncbi:MAG: hypothetical protein ACPG6P_14350, partial [Akkermansiaceae bacterium]
EAPPFFVSLAKTKKTRNEFFLHSRGEHERQLNSMAETYSWIQSDAFRWAIEGVVTVCAKNQGLRIAPDLITHIFNTAQTHRLRVTKRELGKAPEHQLHMDEALRSLERWMIAAILIASQEKDLCLRVAHLNSAAELLPCTIFPFCS